MFSIAGLVSILATMGTTRSPMSSRSSTMSSRPTHERLSDQIDAHVERADQGLSVASGDRRAG